MTGYLVQGLEAEGFKVIFEPFHISETHLALSPLLKERLVPQRYHEGMPVIYVHNGPILLVGGPGTGFPQGSIIFTMWESDRLWPEAVANLNKAKCVLVPCDENKRWFLESGVSAPIRVIPLGIDSKIYHPSIPEPENLFRVGCGGRVGVHGDRKRLGLMAELFLEAFPENEDCFLEIKCMQDCAFHLNPHPRIKVVREALTDRELADWYRSLNVFASASLGEGWGLQPHQAMAVGRPTIAALCGGHKHYMTDETNWSVDFTAPDFCYIDRNSMIRRLREAYENREERLRKGKASEIRAREFTWERTGKELASVIQEFGIGIEPPSPLVRKVSAPVGIDPKIRDRVLNCPDRGIEGALILAEDERSCCGGGEERTECRKGRGVKPGRVTLRECLRCQS